MLVNSKAITIVAHRHLSVILRYHLPLPHAKCKLTLVEAVLSAQKSLGSHSITPVIGGYFLPHYVYNVLF